MRWTLRFAIVLIASLTLAIAAPPFATSSAQTPALTVMPSTGLSGGDVVTISGSGFPTSNEIFYCEAQVVDQPDPSDCGTSFDSVGSDENGAFSVQFAVARFITPANGLGVVDCAQPTAQCIIGAEALGGEAALAPLTFTEQPPATFTLEGTVTGPDQHALANVAVWAYTASDGFVGSLQTQTDADGNYALTITPDVVYSVRFGPPPGSGLIPEWFASQPNRAFSRVGLPQSFNDPIVAANQQLFAGGSISGVVRDSSGAGVPGVSVSAYSPFDRFVGSFGATTAADGSYRIDGVLPSDFLVRFVPPAGRGLAIQWFDNVGLRSSATPVSVTAGATTSGVDDQLAAAP